jgi:thiol-disulfide isomerase/thioredoxin
MEFNNTKVIFLEITDFNNGILTYNGRPFPGKVLVMVQGDFCGYCTKAKPDFIKLANHHGATTLADNSVVFATIKIDGKTSESELSKRLPEITGVNLQGVPAYLLFQNGKFVALHDGGRDAGSLKKFLRLQ